MNLSILAKEWVDDFRKFDLREGVLHSQADETLMFLSEDDPAKALRVVLEVAELNTNPDSDQYLAAQHLEEICVNAETAIFDCLTETEIKNLANLSQYIWVGRIKSEVKEKLVRLIEGAKKTETEK